MLESDEFKRLNNYCESQSLFLTLEWDKGQYWLHSDDSKERPIGIEIDRELERHEDFFKKASVLKEVPAKAIGVRSGYRPRILDLTGGLLGDALLFLSYGCEVRVIERHPIVAFLIRSSLQNATHPLLQKLSFTECDAKSMLEAPPEVDVIYFDPMFEDANTKSLPKKEMRIFRNFIGNDEDAGSIVEMAKKLKPRRLVVKRPRLSKLLLGAPHIVFEGKATRYDVYLP